MPAVRPLTWSGLSLLAGLLAGWAVGRSETAANRGDPGGQGSQPPVVAAPPPAHDTPRLEAPEGARREAALQAEVAALRGALEAAERERDALRAAATPSKAPSGPASLRFGLTGPTPAFDAADWPTLGENARRLAPLMRQMMEGIAKGEPDTPLIQQAGELNMPLAQLTMAAAKELGGTGPNGAFTHPAVLANLMRATLAAMGQPLSEEQEHALSTLGEAWVAEHARMQVDVAPGAPALAALIAEVEAKARFMTAAKRVLTPTQRTALFQPDTEGRAGLDLFSPGLLYTQRIPAAGIDAEASARLALRFLLAPLGLSQDEQAAYTALGARWVEDVPWQGRGIAPLSPDTLVPTLDDLQGFARAQLATLQRILDQGLPTPDQATRLRASLVVVMPHRLELPR